MFSKIRVILHSKELDKDIGCYLTTEYSETLKMFHVMQELDIPVYFDDEEINLPFRWWVSNEELCSIVEQSIYDVSVQFAPHYGPEIYVTIG